jgi:hypothetical protein
MDDVNARSLGSYEEATKEVDLFEGRQLDLSGAASGYGSYCPEGIPGFALSFGILWTALTVATGRRRRKRLAEPAVTFLEQLEDRSSDVLWWGMSPVCTYIHTYMHSGCSCNVDMVVVFWFGLPPAFARVSST